MMYMSHAHWFLAEGSTSFWTLVSNSVRSSSAIENAILLLLVDLLDRLLGDRALEDESDPRRQSG